MKLYGLELSFPVNRVRFCLNAMKLDHEFIRINPLAGENQTKEYLKISPSGKIPAIDDDGFTLFESNAIMKYLARKYDSSFYPDDFLNQADIDKWLDFTAIHVANGYGKVLFNKIIAPLVGAETDKNSLEEGYSYIKRFLNIVNEQLGQSTFLASDTLTIADFCLLGTIDTSEVINVNMAEYPHIDAWRKKLMNEDFYKKVHNSFAETLEAMKATSSE